MWPRDSGLPQQSHLDETWGRPRDLLNAVPIRFPLTLMAAMYELAAFGAPPPPTEFTQRWHSGTCDECAKPRPSTVRCSISARVPFRSRDDVTSRPFRDVRRICLARPAVADTPLSDMLKFGGSSWPSRGPHLRPRVSPSDDGVVSALRRTRPVAGRDGSNSPESSLSLSVRRGNGLSTGHARRSKRRAPFAFKESTIRSAIHTTFLAVGCVLHRCASPEIHRAEHNSPFNQSESTRSFQCKQENYRSRGRQSMMILPQVHLRKPCYDFYFL